MKENRTMMECLRVTMKSIQRTPAQQAIAKAKRAAARTSLTQKLTALAVPAKIGKMKLTTSSVSLPVDVRDAGCRIAQSLDKSFSRYVTCLIRSDLKRRNAKKR